MATNNAINTGKPIEVANGGLGATTYTNHGVLIGQGSSAATGITAGSNGQLLVGSTSASPVMATLGTSLASITKTNGAGTLNLDVASWVGSTSWTPVLAFGGASVGITYGTQTASYRRVGSTVYTTMKIVLTSKGSSTGTATITGFPITAALACQFGISYSKLTLAGQLYGYIVAGTTAINLLYAASTGANAALSDTGFANDSTIILSGIQLV